MKVIQIRALFFALFVFSSIPAWSQWREILHQTFEADSIAEVNLDIFGDYTVELWAGNNILTETKVKLDCGNKNILKFLIDQGRYELEGKTTAPNLIIESKDKVRKHMRINEKDCEEIVNVRIFIPDDFEKTGEHSWKNPDPKGKEE